VANLNLDLILIYCSFSRQIGRGDSRRTLLAKEPRPKGLSPELRFPGLKAGASKEQKKSAFAIRAKGASLATANLI
jgi:hypothetical protein